MPFQLVCSGCQKRLAVPDKYAGKRLKCPQCQAAIEVPNAEEEVAEDDDWLSALNEGVAESSRAPAERTAQPKVSHKEIQLEPSSQALASRRKPMAMTTKKADDEEPDSAAGWREHMHWLLLIALLPLAVSIFFPDNTKERFEQTLQANPQINVDQATDLDSFLKQLPEQRIQGAHLARGSLLHWAYGGLSAFLFLMLLRVTFAPETATLKSLLIYGVLVGTLGIILLLAFQHIAFWTLGFNIRGRGFLMLLFYVVKFIGYSYYCAEDPETGLLMSFIGFTCGVGLCEELCKSLPIILHFRHARQSARWRTAMLWGLACGVGFGLSEGIMYSATKYNGLSTMGIYLVRFASCVALHATWSGTVALMIARRQADLQGDMELDDWAGFLFPTLGLPMVLHGLYDTLLKRDHELWALAVALGSFGWLLFQMKQAREELDQYDA